MAESEGTIGDPPEEKEDEVESWEVYESARWVLEREARMAVVIAGKEEGAVAAEVTGVVSSAAVSIGLAGRP